MKRPRQRANTVPEQLETKVRPLELTASGEAFGDPPATLTVLSFPRWTTECADVDRSLFHLYRHEHAEHLHQVVSPLHQPAHRRKK
jgi:hypothetical protein